MTREQGYDEEFDYAGSAYVAPAPYLKGMGRRLPRDHAQRVGERPAGDGVALVLEGLQARTGGASQSARAMKVWRQIDNPQVRAHVLGLYLREGRGVRELIAYVDHPAWVYEFSLRAPAVLPEWNHLCEKAGLPMRANKLTFKLSSRAHAHTDAPPVSAPASPEPFVPAPLTPDEQARIERAVAVVKDERLRRAAYNAMASSLAWEKTRLSSKGPQKPSGGCGEVF